MDAKLKLRSLMLTVLGINDNAPKDALSHQITFPNVDIQRGCAIGHDCVIGEYSYIGMNTTITRSLIGRYCSIANNVSVGDGEHDLYKPSTSSYFYEDAYKELTKSDCIVGNDVWVGTKSIIRRGVTVGNGAVIGANSFVNKDVPAFAIVVGSPAKILKYRFNEEMMSIISKSNWWELSLEDSRSVVSELDMLLKNK